jgi:hypothetical protein
MCSSFGPGNEQCILAHYTNEFTPQSALAEGNDVPVDVEAHTMLMYIMTRVIRQTKQSMKKIYLLIFYERIRGVHS